MKYVIFPGTPGNYISTQDVNLLDADTAHLQQSTGLWTAGVLSTDHPLFGDNSLKITGGVDTSITPTTDAAMFSVYVYSADGADFNINGSPAVTVPAGIWTQLTEMGPDGMYTIGCSTANDYYIGKACLRTGTDPTFVPSLNIVGTIEEIIDPTDMPIAYAPGSPLTVGDGWAGNGVSYIRNDGTGGPTVAHFDPEDIVLP